jgi:hypothetical protein
MDKAMLEQRLAQQQAQVQQLLQQRARLAELQDQALANLHATQGRIAELADLIALMAEPESDVG